MPKTFPSLAALIVIAFAGSAIAADGKPVLVSVVGKDLKSTMGELGRENDANIEVFDLKTGQGQIFKKADLQTISKDVTEASVIDRVGLSAFMAWRIKKVLPVSFATGKIAQIDGTVVYVSIGSKVGIEAGQELTVYRGATEIRDPDTGELLGKQRKKVAKLEAIEVGEKLTKAKLIGDLETTLQVGDVVEPTVVSNSVAVLPLVNHRGHETIGTKRIAEELITGLVNREISVIERRLLDKVLGELSLQQSAVFDAAKAQKVGKQLGAYAIVMGTVTPKAKFAEAQLRLVRVETGEILVAATQTFREVGDLLGSTGTGVSSTVSIDNEKAEWNKRADETLQEMNRAFQEKRYEEAINFALSAEAAARKANNDATVKRITGRLTFFATNVTNMSVGANRLWQKATTVKSGDIVFIVAKGRWHIWPDGGGDWQSGPEGTKFSAGTGFPLPGAPQGALVGKLNGKAFAVGTSVFVVASEDGAVELTGNDDQRRNDNRGELSVTTYTFRKR